MNNDNQKIKVLNKLVGHYGFQKWWEDDNRLSDWVSMLLIQRTTENNAKKALANLEGYLTVQKLQRITIEKLQELIKPAGFYKQKSIYIKELINWFVSQGGNFEKFEGYSTKKLRKELLSIKGVGPETADVMLLYIFERNVFICDQYAMRLFSRLSLGNYESYEGMRADFQKLAEQTPYLLCREWHTAIDTHGKKFNKNKEIDESWLQN